MRATMFLFLLGLSCALSWMHSTPKRVVSIPRFGPINKTDCAPIHTGYVETDADFGRNLFYYFVEAQESPETKPVIMWLNGGPGCSSGLAFISEHGPFQLSEAGVVIRNKYSLNQLASVIYVDSPAGAGFSFEEKFSEDKNIGDDQTASDLYIFLQVFFTEVFPQYASNEFHIWGESYGGHYVPLAAAYLWEKQHPATLGTDLKINLHGIGVNNGMYSREHYLNGDLWWLFGHSVASFNQFWPALQSCKGNFWQNRADPICGSNIEILQRQIDGLLNLNLESDCYKGVNGTFPGRAIPCWNSEYLDEYFNTPEALTDFSVDPRWATFTKHWWTCSPVVGKVFNSSYDSVIPQLKVLYQAGIRVLIMNGDLDDACSSLSNQWTVNDVLGDEAVQVFPPWYYQDLKHPKEKQVGGFYQMQKNLLFVTVRGAGHMISTDEPYRSFVLYSKFFKGTFPN